MLVVPGLELDRLLFTAAELAEKLSIIPAPIVNLNPEVGEQMLSQTQSRLHRMLLKARILSNCCGIFAIYFRLCSKIPIQQALESGGRHVRPRPKVAYRRS